MIKLVYLTWTTLFFSACKLKGGRGKDLFQKLSTNKSASQYWGYILTYMIQTVLILYLSLRCKIALRQTSNWTAKQNDLLSDQIRLRTQKIWWSLGGSNSWPPECKSGALPAELRPHTTIASWYYLEIHDLLVGRGGLEPPTSRLSGVRSNHLSYRPKLDRDQQL